jgi:lysylphosphatidylglycerol synthetase-like protein (DUF2156 family)
MTVPLAALVLSTLVGVIGIALIATPPPSRDRRRRTADPGVAARAAVTLAAGAITLAFTGWLVAAIVIAVSAWLVVRAVQRRDPHADDVARTEALASWIENLRDVLVAGDQPIGAIGATVSTCPEVIRPSVRRLATSLGRQDPDVAFRRFADDLDDPLGDLVAAGLLIAVQRGARTVAVLSTLAEQARQQADRRRLIDAERAPVQREVRLLTAIMAALVLGLVVFGRAEYLRPYDSAGGQVFLGAVLTIYALLLVRVQRLAAHPRPSRFLAVSPQLREDGALR